MQTGSTLPCKWQGLLKALPVHWSLSLRMAVNEELWGVVAWELPMGEDPFCFLRLLVIFSWRTLDFAGLPRTSPYDLLRPAGRSGVQRLQNMVSWSTGSTGMDCFCWLRHRCFNGLWLKIVDKKWCSTNTGQDLLFYLIFQCWTPGNFKAKSCDMLDLLGSPDLFCTPTSILSSVWEPGSSKATMDQSMTS